MKSTSLLAAAVTGALLSLGIALPLARGDAKPQTIGVDEIHEGMKGYGLTVFKGTEPERFDVEVVGVLHNFRPAQDLILVNTPHPRLNITKNVRGMSGSPIYFNGRLAGAYAYSLAQFQVESIAGVTPIAPMLTELRRPIPAGFWPLEGSAPLPEAPRAPKPTRASGPTAYEGTPGQYDIEEHAAQIKKRIVANEAKAFVPAEAPLLMSGVGDRTAAYAKHLFTDLGLEPLQAGGGQGKTEGAPSHFVDGGTLGVTLVRGDVSMLGLGTVTYVEGTKAVGFGHPMMDAGDTALPTAIGRVLWIFASGQHSSKVGELVKPLGALVQDRQSSVVLDESKVAPTFPVTVDVKGASSPPKTHWQSIVAEERFLSASLTATVLGSVVEATISERRDMTWQLQSKLSVRGHGTIELSDFGVAVGGMPDAGDFARSQIVRTVGDVLNNPFERSHIEKIESVLTVGYTNELWKLRGVEVVDAVIDAGQPARLRVRLSPVAGADVFQNVTVNVPSELAGKDVDIDVAPGYELQPDTAAPQTLGELLSNATKQTLPPRSLVFQIKLKAHGVAFASHVADRLPGFALDALRPQSNSAGPEAFASIVRTVVPFAHYVDGKDKVKVRVRPAH